jgi:hypothetical protein
VPSLVLDVLVLVGDSPVAFLLNVALDLFLLAVGPLIIWLWGFVLLSLRGGGGGMGRITAYDSIEHCMDDCSDEAQALGDGGATTKIGGQGVRTGLALVVSEISDTRL